MPKKIAIDWDDSELRLVAAQCSGSSVNVTDAAIIPIGEDGVVKTLRKAISERGLEKTETLVAIGRGKAELRELTLPPVPDDELPDMVRFQAIRSFASAGETATFDFLVTDRKPDGVSMIAAAVVPATLNEISKTCESAELISKRIALRPLSSAALYLSHPKYKNSRGDTVLIDLLADDAEIIIARDDRVIFVRTVRMPTEPKSRASALAGELRRSLMASGVDAAPEHVVLWGRQSVHQDDVEQISAAVGTKATVLNPFDLVDVDRKLIDRLPDHVGRLAPLVGLLASDGIDADRLIDFLHPRKRPEAPPNHLRKALMIGAPIAAVLLLSFLVYRQLQNLDSKIAALQAANESQSSVVKAATTSLARTEALDVYLDGGVNWLEELRALASKIPPADKMIVKSISADTDQRSKGGGKLVLAGAVTGTEVIDQFELAVRDQAHQVSGEGTKVIETEDAYRLEFREEISIPADHVRAMRYQALAPEAASPTTQAAQVDSKAEKDPPIPDSPPDVMPTPKSSEQESLQESEQESQPSAETPSAPSITHDESSAAAEVKS